MEPATQVCALTGIKLANCCFAGCHSNQLSHTGQVQKQVFPYSLPSRVPMGNASHWSLPQRFPTVPKLLSFSLCISAQMSSSGKPPTASLFSAGLPEQQLPSQHPSASLRELTAWNYLYGLFYSFFSHDSVYFGKTRNCFVFCCIPWAQHSI